MALIILAFHHPHCIGEGDEGCHGFVAHANTLPEAVAHAFDGGIDATVPWRIMSASPIPDRWIDGDYIERVLTYEETRNIPEPKEFANFLRADEN